MEAVAVVSAFGSPGEALGMLESAARFLAATEYAGLPAAVTGQVLLGLERADAAGAVARGRALTAFDAADGHEDDGQRTTGAWLVNIAGVSKDEARAHRGWGRLVGAHPVIAAAMGESGPGGAPVMSKSRARKICSLTSQIPEPFREEADTIVVAAARAGAALRDLVYIAAEILARTAPADEDDKPFADRLLRLETTLDGAGVLSGQLSPECAAAVQAVLGQLAKRSGADDHRCEPERLHDALHDAMLRLLSSELMPKKNGHPVQAVVHVGLADLLALDDGSVLGQQWTARLAARWAAARAGAAVSGGDGAAWIAGPAAPGIACDASLFPIVSGAPDLDALDDLIRLCVELDHCLHDSPAPASPAPASADAASADAADAVGPGQAAGSSSAADRGAEAADRGAEAADRGEHAARVEELIRQVIGQAAALLSGEAGLASFLRRNLLGQAGLGGRTLPLDVGDTDEVPWWIRRAVHSRDQGCRWPSGCGQPAEATQPHHVRHRCDGGVTKTENLYDFCWWHHHVMIHRRGWMIRVRGDGTLEARSPDGRVYTDHTRPPPPQSG